VYDIFVHDQQTGITLRVSVSSDGTEGNGASGIYNFSISADGWNVAFSSDATNLVDMDTNGTGDIFVHDIQTGETTLVSVATDGTQGDSLSLLPSISSDGRFVAFYSNSTNLVSGDTNGTSDVFVHDQQTGETKRVSVASDGTQGDNFSDYPSISSDGRYVAFYSSATNLVIGDTNGTKDVFVHDMQTSETRRLSVASDLTQGDGNSLDPSISLDGLYVAFESSSTNLVAGDTNGCPDVFVRDIRFFWLYLPILSK
jgi:Tol biopolymer transport system component